MCTLLFSLSSDVEECLDGSDNYVREAMTLEVPVPSVLVQFLLPYKDSLPVTLSLEDFEGILQVFPSIIEMLKPMNEMNVFAINEYLSSFLNNFVQINVEEVEGIIYEMAKFVDLTEQYRDIMFIYKDYIPALIEDVVPEWTQKYIVRILGVTEDVTKFITSSSVSIEDISFPCKYFLLFFKI